MHANVLQVFLNCNISMYKAGYAHYHSISHYQDIFLCRTSAINMSVVTLFMPEVSTPIPE